MSVAKPRCQGMNWSGSWRVQCRHGASLEHEGKHFCKRHHPPTMQAKGEARQAEWRERTDREIAAREAANAASKEINRRAALFPDLLDALQKIAAIQNQSDGPDWEEIEEARGIANAAIAKATGEPA